MAGASLLGACGDDDGGSTAAFCDGVTANQALLFGPLPDPPRRVDVMALIGRWRRVGADAPLAVEADWNGYIAVLQTALDADDVQVALASAYANEGAAVDVATWLAENCDLTIPVATIVGHSPEPGGAPGSGATDVSGPPAATGGGATPAGTGGGTTTVVGG